ncbi:SDR family NAD(P)-dependent oxidoreductase [Thermodesulfobacteriota bacterium]
MELEGKIALVTGAGQGIGKAIALTFAKEGADVAANDINLDMVETTASEVKALGRRSMAVKADVSDEEAVNRMVEQVSHELGGIDILVNNAGIGNTRMVEDMTKSEWRHVLGVNLDGTFYCSKAVIETMKGRGGGKIVNISSLAGKKMSYMACAAYTASKAGILGFTRHLSFEVGPYKIRVNAICPGAVLTPKLQAPPEHIKTISDGMPLKDICRPEDIADTALFLASSRSRMITGTVIDVDAGISVANQDYEGYKKRRKEAFAKGEQAH